MADMPTSRLQGWDYIKSLIYVCPVCGEVATLGNPANNNRWRVCCMNITCPNFKTTELHDNPFMAIDEWNKKYGERRTDEALQKLP